MNHLAHEPDFSSPEEEEQSYYNGRVPKDRNPEVIGVGGVDIRDSPIPIPTNFWDANGNEFVDFSGNMLQPIVDFDHRTELFDPSLESNRNLSIIRLTVNPASPGYRNRNGDTQYLYYKRINTAGNVNGGQFNQRPWPEFGH